MLPWQINNTLIIFLYLHLSLVFLLKRLIFQGFPTFEFSFLFKVSSQIFSYFLMFFPAILVNPLVKQASLPTGFFNYSLSDILLPLHHQNSHGVSVQGYTDVCVTHDILQGFRIHPGFCHIRAKGVPAYMRGNFQHLDTVNPVVFLNDMLQILFPVKGNHRHIVFIQKQKSCISFHHRFNFWCLAVGNDSAKTRCDSFRHRHIADAFVSFWFFNYILHLCSTL